MNILPKKSWHVRNKDNIARVRRDEARAAEEEREIQRRVERAEQEARTDHLRKKSRAALEQKGGFSLDGELEGERSRGSEEIEHLNLFPLEESSEKKGNAEYLKEKREEKEKQERAIGLLVSLGPAPGTESTPWYLKDRQEPEKEERERTERGKRKTITEEERERTEKGKRKTITEEEKEKKDRKLKERLDPLMDMKKALAVKDGKEKKHKKKEKKRDGVEKKTGESALDRLRAERLRREAEERRRAQVLLDQKSGAGSDREAERERDDRERPYNSAYFPELARKRQRTARDLYSF